MITQKEQSATWQVSRRTVLRGLAGSVAGLVLLPAGPVASLARSALGSAGATYTRGQTLYAYKTMFEGLFTVDWSPNGQRIVSAGVGFDPSGNEIQVQIWDALTGKNMVTYTGDGDGGANGINSAEWSPDGTHIASGEGFLGKIWDPTTGQTLTTYSGHATTVSALTTIEWAPDSQRVASSGFGKRLPHDNSIHIWDASTGVRLVTYSGHTTAVSRLGWSPDGRSIASGTYSLGGQSDCSVHVWDTFTGQLLLRYTGHTDAVNAVIWSPDGTRVASASQDGTVQIWNPFTGKGYLTYHGHLAGVEAVDWSPDGQLIASGSGDRTVQLWSPTSPKTLFYYYGNGADGLVNDVAWSPNGQLIVSGTQPFPAPTQGQALVWVGR